MIIRERQILVGSGDRAERLMVLWVGVDRVALLDLLNHASKPHFMASTALEAAVVARTLTIDPNPLEISRGVGRELGTAEKEARDHFWKLIEPLVTNVPTIFNSAERGRLVAARANEGLASVNTIKAKIDRYWRGGMRVAALIPDFRSRGPRGSLPAKADGRKRGRPLEPDVVKPGVAHADVTVETQQAFQRAVDAERKIAKNRFTLNGAHTRFINHECMVAVENVEAGKVTFELKPEFRDIAPPGYRQFKWWYDRTRQKAVTGRILKGDALWEKDNKVTVGSSAAQTWGPGSRFQIDATILEIALLSRHRPGDIIGKPVLYVVIDVWSRYVVGFYIGVTNASWAGAAMALANCLAPKDELLERCGFDPKEFPWESRHMAAALLGDGGELKSHRGDVLSSEFNCTVETASPLRADWKGIVEQRFNIVNVKIGPYAPGHVDTTYRGRGAEDYRLSARLTITDLTEILVGLFLEYNNYHELEDLDVDPDVDAAGIPKIPLHLWRFGLPTRGEPRSYDYNAFRFAMMASDWAPVTPSGIVHRGRFYNCPELLASGLLSMARDGHGKARISWDDRIAGEIYWHDQGSPTGYYVCRPTEKSRNAAEEDRSSWEMDDADNRRGTEANQRQHENLGKRAEIAHRFQKVVERAESAFNEIPDDGDRNRLSGIRENRKAEREDDAAAEAPPLIDPSPVSRPGPHLTLVQTDDDNDDDYSDIGMADLGGDDE